MILDYDLVISIHWSHFWRAMFWARKVRFWGEAYLHLLNNRIYRERSFENLHCTNLSKLKQISIQILMNENNKSFYLSDMFEFIHHPKYGCCDLEGLMCHLTYYYSNPILILKIWIFNKITFYFENIIEVVQVYLEMLFKCRTNVFLFFILNHMNLDFLFEIMYKTCVNIHFKIKESVKICAKNI